MIDQGYKLKVYFKGIIIFIYIVLNFRKLFQLGCLLYVALYKMPHLKYLLSSTLVKCNLKCDTTLYYIYTLTT